MMLEWCHGHGGFENNDSILRALLILFYNPDKDKLWDPTQSQILHATLAMRIPSEKLL